jgi:D-alanyl-lipoteichoic acid acyltransferase DltB (MBOAT superfamily)
MLFHSLQFAVFFLIVYNLYLALPHKWQNRTLLLASYVFYGAWEWRYLGLIFLSTLCDYCCGLGIQNSKNKNQRKKIIAVSVFFNLSLLGIFKYYDFFAMNLRELLSGFGIGVQPYLLELALPVGISFYTFQTISYTIDVYRGELKAERNFFDFALYVSFFPQLVAGPIERGVRLLPQLRVPRILDAVKIYHGVYLFLWGIFLKVFIADNLSGMVDPVYSSEGPYNGAEVLLATYAFSFQIYCDFAGYSFMAIGLGLMMGIELIENFRRPFFSKNIAEFWRRWHISLSNWFRDYVFFPFYFYLRNGKSFKKIPIRIRHALAFLISLLSSVYLLGLWHGAGWNFGYFGLYHGVMIATYYIVRRYWDKMNSYLQIFLTFQLACIGFMIFRTSSLDQFFEMFHSVWFNFKIVPDMNYLDQVLKFSSFIIILVSIQVFQDLKDDTLAMIRLPLIPRYFFVSMLIILTVYCGKFEGKPFIYFQF